MEKKCTNSDEIFEILLRDGLTKKLSEESETLVAESENHEFSEKFSKNIRKATRKIDSEKRRRTALKVTSRSLVTLACALGVAFCLLLTQPPVYAAVNQVFKQVFDGYDKYSFTETSEDVTFNTEIRPDYIPDGYKLRMVYYGDINVEVTYEDYDGQRLCFDYSLATDGTSFSTDNENSTVSEYLIDGIQYYCYQTFDEYGLNTVVWIDDGYIFSISAQIDIDVLVQIAESVGLG